MARLPIRKNQHARAQLTNDARDLDPVAKGVLDATIRDVESPPPTDFQDARCLVGLTRPVVNAAARAHFALREVEDGGAASRSAILSSVPPQVCSTSSRWAAMARMSQCGE